MNCDIEATELILSLSHIAPHLWALAGRNVCLAVKKDRMKETTLVLIY